VHHARVYEDSRTPVRMRTATDHQQYHCTTTDSHSQVVLHLSWQTIHDKVQGRRAKYSYRPAKAIDLKAVHTHEEKKKQPNVCSVEPLLSGLMTGCRWPDNRRRPENDLLMPPYCSFPTLLMYGACGVLKVTKI
jgi:hypothetical protein